MLSVLSPELRSYVKVEVAVCIVSVDVKLH